MTDTNGSRPVFDPDLLTPRDLRMAREALPDEDIQAMMNDRIDLLALTVFCMRRRENPEFSWDEALDTPMSAWEQPEPDVPPPTLPSGSLGRSATTPSVNGSKAKPAKPTTVPASSPSTP